MPVFSGRDLNSLEDVNSPSPTDNYVLTYDSATGMWLPEDATDLAATKLREKEVMWYFADVLTSDDYHGRYINVACTMTKVRCERNAGTSYTFNIEKRPEGSAFSAGTDIWSADEVITANESITVFSSGAVSAGTWLYMDVSAVSGSVTDFLVAAVLTVD